jgi:hypothetical protein
VREALLAVAGPVGNDRCVLTNSAWTIDAPELCAAFSFAKVHILNDFEATAGFLQWGSLRALNTATLQMRSSPSMPIRRRNWRKQVNTLWPAIALAFRDRDVLTAMKS